MGEDVGVDVDVEEEATEGAAHARCHVPLQPCPPRPPRQHPDHIHGGSVLGPHSARRHRIDGVGVRDCYK